jgi:tetratricopeptide (TPR) repeat protein
VIFSCYLLLFNAQGDCSMSSQFASYFTIYFGRSHNLAGWVCLAYFLSVGLVQSQDKIILRQGPPVQGEIQGVDAAGNVTIKFDKGTIPYPKANIESVEVAERPEYVQGVAAILEENFPKGIELLQPLTTKFLGLDAPWVADAAGYLAEALAATGKTFESEQICDKIIQSYPNSVFRYKGMVGKATILLSRDKADEAMALLDQVDKAINISAIPDRKSLRILNHLYYVKAQVFEKKGDKQQALESYLKVAALYYEPKKRADAAQAKADALRKSDPKLVVN